MVVTELNQQTTAPPSIPWENLTEDGGVKRHIMVPGEGEILSSGDKAASVLFQFF
jgi:hypothetical protein